MKQNKFIMLFLFISVATFILIKYNSIDNSSIAVYLDNIESASIPDRNSNYIIDKIVCDNDAVGTWDNVNWSLLVTNLSKRSNCKLYFRSKKDITITYDNNFIKNNIFPQTYKVSKVEKNQIYSSNTNYSLTNENNCLNYKFSANTDEKVADYSTGYFLYANNKLEINKTYTFQFLVKGNSSYKAYIGSEQEIYSGYKNFTSNITSNWNRITRTFTASNYKASAFVFYGWISKDESRTLEVKNIQLQEGEYDNYLTIFLKENDILGETLPTPTRDNYTFLGWYTAPIDGDKISGNTVVSNDATYYAHWQYNV